MAQFIIFFFNCVHILLGGSLADWSQQRPGSLVFSTRAKAAGYGRWFLIDHGAGSNKKKVEKTHFEARYYGLQTDSSPVLSKALISSNEKTFHRPLRTRCRIRLPRPFSAWVTRMIERFFGYEFFDSGIFSRKSWQVLFLVAWFNEGFVWVLKAILRFVVVLAYPSRVMFLFFLLYHLMLSGNFWRWEIHHGIFLRFDFCPVFNPGGGGAGFNHPRHLKSWVPPPTGVLTIFFDCSLLYSMFNNTFLEKLLWFDWLLHEIFYYTLFQLYLGRHLTLSRAGKNFIRILL